MGLKLYEETSVQAIADAIRTKNGSSDTYTISEMSTAIGNIPSGGFNGEILTDNSFTDDFQAFTEGSMSNATTAGGKVNITWNGGSSIGYCRCGKTAYKNATKVKVHIDYYGDSYGHQHTNNRNWNFAVFVTDIRLTSAVTLTSFISDPHCLDYIECDNNQYYGQMNLDFEFDLSEITDAVYISYQSPGVTIQGLKITVVYEDESDLYKYHWSNDGKICVREELGAVKWFFMGLTKDGDDIEVPTELVSYLPDFEAPGQYMHAIAFTDPEDAWDGSHYIGFVYPGTANVKIRSWYSTSLGGGTFWGVLDITHYPFTGQQNEYVDPTDIPDIDVSLIEKTITENGTYSAEDDGYVGYSDVVINVAGGGASDITGNCIINASNILTGHIIDITVPNSATSISNSAFTNCTSLSSITLPNSITSIGNSAFSGCTRLSSITLPNSITSISNSSFQGCTSLTSVTLPNNITSIGSSAFSGCTRLSSITLPNSITSIGDSAFTNCTSLSSITLPNNITSIGVSAFANCTSLSSVTLPSSITSISNSSFQGCTGLTSVTLPSSITHIGNSAFTNCTSLSSITLPSSITGIGTYAFYNCTGLTSIVSENITPPAINSNTFTNVPATCMIYVPAESVELYKTSSSWSSRANYIQAIPE